MLIMWGHLNIINMFYYNYIGNLVASYYSLTYFKHSIGGWDKEVAYLVSFSSHPARVVNIHGDFIYSDDVRKYILICDMWSRCCYIYHRDSKQRAWV